MDLDTAAGAPPRTVPGRSLRDRTSIFQPGRRATDCPGQPLLSAGQPGTCASSFRCGGRVVTRESNGWALWPDIPVSHVRALQEFPIALGHACIDVHHMDGSVRVPTVSGQEELHAQVRHGQRVSDDMQRCSVPKGKRSYPSTGPDSLVVEVGGLLGDGRNQQRLLVRCFGWWMPAGGVAQSRRSPRCSTSMLAHGQSLNPTRTFSLEQRDPSRDVPGGVTG